jgi:pimeloyl-ACP methyl ester carboxylesterase
LVNYLPPQVEFKMAEFDSGRFNVHPHLPGQDGLAPTLIVLVHGLGGGGYRTWGPLSARLFSGVEGPAFDVGVYDYRSLHRGLLRRGGKIDFWNEQLAGHLRELEARYSNIVLVGHSLGGLLIEAVAKDYLTRRALEHREGQGSLIALILIAAPRAGSGWADIPLVEHFLPEMEILRRLGTRSAEIDAFFTDNIERLNIADALPSRRVVLPVYAALGGGDKLVSRFSAAFGVPTLQRLNLDAGHGDIKTPEENDAELIRWLHRMIAERIEVVTQAARARQHAGAHIPQAAVDPRPVVVTRFSSDPSGMDWEAIYNRVCTDATTTVVRIQDIREASGGNTHLVMTVHDAGLIVASNPVVRQHILHVHTEQQNDSSMSVGVCLVGEKFNEAVAVVQGWLTDLPHADSFYVKGAADEAQLRDILARMLQIVIERKTLSEHNGPYDGFKGGSF